MSFARVWTGLDVQSSRGNVESRNGKGAKNWIDPIQFKPVWRDRLPKAKLDESGYIGDGYPLCSSLTSRSFLSKGAKYVYVGAKSGEGTWLDDPNNNFVKQRPRFSPQTDSELFRALCQRDVITKRCTFPAEVTLENNFECAG